MAHTAEQVGAIIAAAGSGTRLGRPEPKALVLLAGEPLVVHAVRAVLASGVVDQVVVTAPGERCAEIAAALHAASLPAQVVAGGTSRQESVAAGLAHLAASSQLVLIHDAARPLVPASMVRDVVAQLRAGHPAVVPGVAVADTLRLITTTAGGPVGAAVVDRDRVRAMQTPQGFARALLARAHRHARGEAHLPATDDAALVEALGVTVRIVAGDVLAFKITTELDLALAETIVAKRGSQQ